MIKQNDLKLRLFIDTNILIDYYEHNISDVSSFINEAVKHNQLDLVTSDFVVWEYLEYIRMEEWIKVCISRNLGSKTALNYRLEIDEPLRIIIDSKLNDIISDLENNKFFLIEHLMNNAVTNFYELLKNVMVNSKINGKDALILTSAYLTSSQILITKDETFSLDYNKLKEIDNFLNSAYLPSGLKYLKICKPSGNNPNSIYKSWFERKFNAYIVASVFKVFTRNNVIGIECNNQNLLRTGNYLALTKFDMSNNFKIKILKIENGSLRNYKTRRVVKSGTKVTVKFPNSENVERWMENSNVFLIDEI